jgi:hypothetical protein
MQLSRLLIAFLLGLVKFGILLKHRFTRNMHLIVHLGKEKQGLQLLGFEIEKTEGSLIRDRLALLLNQLQL